MITVKLYGIFRFETGLESFGLDTAVGITVGKAVLQIVDQYPVLKKYWISADGGLSDHILVTLNGKDIYAQHLGLQTLLNQEDRLDFFSPLAGG